MINAVPEAVTSVVPRARGSVDDNHDVDAYRVELIGGQRYFIELLVSPSWDIDSPNIELSLSDVLGAVQGPTLRSLLGTVGRGYRDASAFTFTAAESGSFIVAATGQNGVYQAVPYALQVASVAADDHADLHPAATAATLGAVVRGVFDLPGDSDSFAFDLAQGQHVLFDVAGTPGAGSSRLAYRARLFDAQDQQLPVYAFADASKLQLGFTAAQAGRYVLELRSTAASGMPGGAALGSYELSAVALPSDDHADLRAQATPLALDTATPVRLDHAGDVDWFRVELAAGERYGIAMRTAAASSNGFVLSLQDAAGQELQSSSGAGLVFEAPAAGSYFLRALSGTSVVQVVAPLDCMLTATRLTVPDVGGAPWNAAPLVLGQTVGGSHLGPGDDDVYRFEAVAGQRYEAIYDRLSFVPEGSQLYFTSRADGSRDLDDISAGQLVDARQRVAYEAPTAGPAYLVLRPPFMAPDAVLNYQVSVSAVAPDDHGNTRATATSLAPGSMVLARPESGDVDLFRVELAAGQRYRFEVTELPSRFDHGPLSMSVFGSAGSLPLVSTNRSSSLVYVAPSSGSYYLSADYYGNDFAVSYRAIAPDDQGDDALHAQSLEIATSYDSGGLLLQGTAAADRLFGGSRADRIDSQGGDDELWGGGGDDRIDGGAGLDSVHFDGRRSNYQLAGNPDGSWTVRALSGVAGQDTLYAVERLRFDGATEALALDLAGNAGGVAKIVGALFGKPRLGDLTIVGIGLKYLDAGVSYPDLIAAAVASPAFAAAAGSHNNADFVRLVYANVVGSVPGPQEFDLYKGLLDSGAYSQAGLALLACETELNKLGIDLVGLASTGLLYLPST